MKHIEANSGTRIQLVGKGSNTTAPGEEEGPLCIRITAPDQQSAEARLYLPSISPISPLYLPCTAPDQQSAEAP